MIFYYIRPHEFQFLHPSLASINAFREHALGQIHVYVHEVGRVGKADFEADKVPAGGDGANKNAHN